MDYENDIVISCEELDVEWLAQPRLMMEYTQHAAEMRRDMDKAKEKVDVVRAELDQRIRQDPDEYDIDKITNPVVEAVIINQQEYKDATKEYLDTKYEHDVAQGVVRAFDQRKTALENLVKLHGQQYFAGPKVPRDLSEEVVKNKAAKKRRSKRINEDIGKSMRRKQ